MKKVLSVLMAMMLSLSMAACSSKNSSSTDSSISDPQIADSSISDNASEADSEPDNAYENTNENNITGLMSTINIAVNFADGTSEISGLLDEPKSINDGISLTVYNSVTIDSEKYKGDIYADIYVFCEGRIIKHSGAIGEEATERTRHTIDTVRENEIPIYIPPTSIGDVDETLLWVYVNYLPDYIPADGWGECTLSMQYYVPVTSSGSGVEASVYEAQESDYIYNKNLNDISLAYPIDIGSYDSTKDEFEISKGTHEKFSVIDNDTEFAILARIENEYDCYLAVFCNGELVDQFDDKTFLKMNCGNGERMLKYTINKDAMPENGAYAFQVIAMPVNNDDLGAAILESGKRRVEISLSE